MTVNLLLSAVLTVACPVSPIENPHPGVISPMVGQEPAWLVDGSNGHAGVADEPIKTLWVLSRKATGSLRVTGRRLEDDATLRFRDGMDAQPASSLDIADPWARSVRPGGATAEILRAYSFVPSYVLYPGPGCWDLTVELGAVRTHIVLNIK